MEILSWKENPYKQHSNVLKFGPAKQYHTSYTNIQFKHAKKAFRFTIFWRDTKNKIPKQIWLLIKIVSKSVKMYAKLKYAST